MSAGLPSGSGKSEADAINENDTEIEAAIFTVDLLTMIYTSCTENWFFEFRVFNRVLLIGFHGISKRLHGEVI